jgi:acyl-CoA thioester hydrolase
VPDSFVHRIRVRYGECDPQGIVFNANWLAYFDVVLTELWRERVRDYAEMVASGTDMVVAEAGVRFLGPAAFDDEIEFELTVTRLGETGLSTRIVARVGGSTAVEGSMRHVFVEPAGKGKKPMPDDIRAALRPLLAESQPATA